VVAFNRLSTILRTRLQEDHQLGFSLLEYLSEMKQKKVAVF